MPVISDFRVRDMAAGGQGAPLVPYTEFLLYRDENASVGLQNIGGIGNLTVLPKGGALADTFAFDTGPGNMVMDQLTARITGGKLRFDAGGQLAAQGRVHPALLNWMMQDPYLKQKPPKTSGRERYGAPYVDALQREAERLGVSPLDQLATATRFTAACIRSAIENDCSAKAGKAHRGRRRQPEPHPYAHAGGLPARRAGHAQRGSGTGQQRQGGRGLRYPRQ